MTDKLVIIAGGGIGGLVTALTLHQIGVRCIVFEAVRDMRPLGVGINLQPNAVRELYDLGITAKDLDRVGLPAQEWTLVGLNGNDIYSEPRGLLAGYNWPQYAVHRGRFHMLLYERVRGARPIHGRLQDRKGGWRLTLSTVRHRPFPMAPVVPARKRSSAQLARAVNVRASA
jgi:5-methylphenazine-1-carboxylate 1-monooxygenase